MTSRSIRSLGLVAVERLITWRALAAGNRASGRLTIGPNDDRQLPLWCSL